MTEYIVEHEIRYGSGNETYDAYAVIRSKGNLDTEIAVYTDEKAAECVAAVMALLAPEEA